MSRKYATMWLDAFARGTHAWDEALFGAGVEADLASGVLSDLAIN